MDQTKIQTWDPQVSGKVLHQLSYLAQEIELHGQTMIFLPP